MSEAPRSIFDVKGKVEEEVVGDDVNGEVDDPERAAATAAIPELFKPVAKAAAIPGAFFKPVPWRPPFREHSPFNAWMPCIA